MLIPKTLQRYVLSDFFKTFVLALTVLTLIFLLGTSLRVVRKFKDLELALLLQVITPMMLGAMSLTLPISVLAACCLTFSRLAHDNEITAMRACGIHLNHVIWPVLGAGGMLTLVAAILTNTAVPWARRENKRLATQAIDQVLTSALSAGPQTIGFFPGLKLHCGGMSRESEGIVLKQLVIHRVEGNLVTQEIMAERGVLNLDGKNKKAVLTLHNGSVAHIRRVPRVGAPVHRTPVVASPNAKTEGWIIVEIEQNDHESTWAGFEKYELELELPSGVDPHRGPRAKEATWPQISEALVESERGRGLYADGEGIRSIRAELAALQSSGGDPARIERLKAEKKWHEKAAKGKAKDYNKFLTERFKRFSLPLACLVVVLLGAPMGILVRHSNKLVAFAISALPVFGLYYPLMMFGERLGEKGTLHPAVAMSIPNLVVGAIGLGLLFRLYRR